MRQHEAKSRLRMGSGGSKSIHLLQSQAGNAPLPVDMEGKG
jgi:hypothetical protein